MYYKILGRDIFKFEFQEPHNHNPVPFGVSTVLMSLSYHAELMSF